MSAFSELSKKRVIDRTPLDNSVLFSRHGDVQQAAAELAALHAVVEAAMKFRHRAYHAPMCPKRADFSKVCDCYHDEFIAALDGVK